MLTKANGHSKGQSKGTTPYNGFFKPPIHAFGEESRKVTKETSLTVKLWSNPKDQTSGTYEVTIVKLDGSETAWQLLLWHDTLQLIYQGQGIKGGQEQVQMARRCMTAQPLMVFDRKVTEMTTGATPSKTEDKITPEEVQKCLLEIRTAALPKDAQRHEVFYVKHLRKPADSKVRA